MKATEIRDMFKREYVFAKEEEKLVNEGHIKSVVGEEHPSVRAKRLRKRLKEEFLVDVDKFDRDLGFTT